MRNYSHNPKLLPRQGFKFSFFRVTFLSPLLVATFLLITIPLTAVKPQQFSDYQRKDLAKAGVTKVIYQYEATGAHKRKDTLSIRQYNSDGFLIALDSFELGKNRQQFLASQKFFYSQNNKRSSVRVEMQQRTGDYFGEATGFQTFDETKKMILSASIRGKDTTILNFKYDVYGNLTEKLASSSNKTDPILWSYTYEYDSNKKIVKEEYWIKSKLSDVKRYWYDQDGLITEFKREDGTGERYHYNESGKKISAEMICPVLYGNHFGDEQLRDTYMVKASFYEYNDQGLLNRIKEQQIECVPSPAVISEYEENLTYLPSGLQEARCGPWWCYRLTYFKKN